METNNYATEIESEIDARDPGTCQGCGGPVEKGLYCRTACRYRHVTEQAEALWESDAKKLQETS